MLFSRLVDTVRDDALVRLPSPCPGLPRLGRATGVCAMRAAPRRAELRGRGVTLVDDVTTTGATGAQAARTLLQAGAAEVGVWAIARSPRHDDP